MKNESPTEDIIRQYLLGRLDDDELKGRLSKQMFFDEGLSETVDLIEDQIIEDYLDGTVSKADRIAIEQYFLRPPERTDKLQVAYALREHFNTTSVAPALKKNAVRAHSSTLLSRSSLRVLIQHYHLHHRTYYELAAAILLIATSLLYVSAVSHKLQSEIEANRRSQTQLQTELLQERHHATSLEHQLQAIPPVILPFERSRFRYNTRIPEIEIKPWTQRIRVEINLPNMSSGNYDVRLENKARQTIWSWIRLPAPAGELRFDMPKQVVSTGDYCLLVSTQPERYCFRVRIVQQSD